jgi:two-component system response regulator GlrR
MHDKQRLKVAVVDDDGVTREMVCGMLQALGYQAVALESAAELALARQEHGFHALVLDLAMPDVDGFELMYQLAERQPVEPVIISSSLSNVIKDAASLVCQSLDIPVLGVLSKPFSSDELAFFLAPHTRAVGASQG